MTCSVCGGPTGKNNKSGICDATTLCKKQRWVNWRAGNRAKNALCYARVRARNQSLPFGLTAENMPELPELCQCCGRPMKWGGSRLEVPALDRIIPAYGYVPENVQWLCGRCNMLKHDADAAELMRLAIFVKRAEEAACERLRST